MKPFFTLLLTIMLMIIINLQVMGQPELPTNPSQAPIDGGLSILAAVGGAYAIKKLRERKKKDDLTHF